ncbi:MAG: enoyl-CoA hydratase/isomerase family protein [Actinomycetota bacterium]|nr:enoyl-CoA hydratase/isomerase family protein [Actinomycetota bacterium]
MAEAAARLRGFRDGSLDAADVLAAPILVVDADLDGDPAELDVPPAFPAVVVAVARAAAPALSRRGPDVAITALGQPLPPWVTEPEPQGAAARLVARVMAAPGAAITLVGVLRAGRDAGIEGGLLLESLAYSMLQSGPEFSEWKKGRPPPPDRPAVGPAVLVERAGDRLEITLNRPHVHNAYDREMRDGLCEALAVAHADPNLSVLIRGAGPSFCSGGDLDEFGTFPDPVTSHLVRTGRSPARLLAALAARTTVVVHGSCAGSGIELPAFAGRVVAHPGSRMWLPELRMGLIPGAGGTVSVARRVGAGRAAWMALSGEPVDAVTAWSWGLVDEVSGQGD